MKNAEAKLISFKKEMTDLQNSLNEATEQGRPKKAQHLQKMLVDLADEIIKTLAIQPYGWVSWTLQQTAAMHVGSAPTISMHSFTYCYSETAAAEFADQTSSTVADTKKIVETEQQTVYESVKAKFHRDGKLVHVGRQPPAKPNTGITFFILGGLLRQDEHETDDAIIEEGTISPITDCEPFIDMAKRGKNKMHF